MDNPEEKHCKTWWLLNLLRSKKDSSVASTFAQAAQSALDASETEPPKQTESLYRAGLTLAELKPGQCGTVRRLLGPSQNHLRILEMGLIPGTHIRLTRAAAFGGPLEILIRGYQLSLRREEAALVWLDDEENEAKNDKGRK